MDLYKSDVEMMSMSRQQISLILISAGWSSAFDMEWKWRCQQVRSASRKFDVSHASSELRYWWSGTWGAYQILISSSATDKMKGCDSLCIYIAVAKAGGKSPLPKVVHRHIQS